MKNITLQPFIEAVAKENLVLEGVIVWQDGEEKARHHFIPEVRRNQFSVSKSFTATAVGFALEEGLFSLTDLVADHFAAELPKNPPENLLKLTVRDLLTMAPGQDKAHLMGDDRPALAKKTDDFVSYALAQPFPYAPGTHFHYNNMGPYLAGILIQRFTGMNLVSYLMPRLFTPLGISAPHWEQDPKGYTFGAGGLEISVSELAKFTRLYLQKGEWEGKQILSKSWIAEATKKQIANDHETPADNRLGYGYLFWRGQHDSYRAYVKYAKFGIVLQDKNAAIIINADESRSQMVLDAAWETIYPQL
jgi:CubicO group peptidase (beta-lactamase class C family)